MGLIPADYTGKPVIAIINTWSDANPCIVISAKRAEEVKRDVWQAGGFPMEMPAISLGETFPKPTTLMYRNFLAMETEELLRSYPVVGCVLLGGCDKNSPALMMGAFSMNLPSIFVPAGPMLRGNWRGQVLGSGADVMKYWNERNTPTMNGPTNPPKFPTELMNPIEAAAADSVRNSVGTGQNAGWKPKYAPPTPIKKRIASRRLDPMLIAIKRKSPLNSRGTTACQRRSQFRSECQPFSC